MNGVRIFKVKKTVSYFSFHLAESVQFILFIPLPIITKN